MMFGNNEDELFSTTTPLAPNGEASEKDLRHHTHKYAVVVNFLGDFNARSSSTSLQKLSENRECISIQDCHLTDHGLKYQRSITCLSHLNNA
ncbi:unnamed protein product [Brugia pahangi]|uniref:Endo/exonuclease/phosphatase domain-containing protein n=1 Tax=Brugia pahangi TaxID=6280 RepID=A0A0N4TC75_BRUPA|nr:unnamed protein product [Brugia pahangi]